MLAEVSPVLDRLAPDRERLFDALDLEADELIAALGGRRRGALESLLSGQGADIPAHMQACCVHTLAALPGSGPPATAPRALFAAPRPPGPPAGPAHSGPRVALLAGPHATPYGRECAYALGRGLAVAGIVPVARASTPAGARALEGALEVAGPAVALLDGSAGAMKGRVRALAAAIGGAGGAVLAQLPAGSTRRWGAPAAEMLCSELAVASVLVEAREDPRALAVARRTLRSGRGLGALPGPVTSPWSRGPHALVREGAALVRGTGDVLALPGLEGAADASHARDRRPPDPSARQALPRALAAVLDRVRGGAVHPDELTRGGDDPAAVLCALSELELRGLLARTDGGGYLARPQEDPHA